MKITFWKEGGDEENVAKYVEGSGDVRDIMRLLNEKTAIKKKSQRFNWEFDKHQSQYIFNKKTGEIEKEEDAVTKIGKLKKKSGLYYDSDEKWQKLVEEYSLEELKLKIINYFKNNELSIPTKLNDDELYEDDLEFILKDSESFDDFIDAEDENRPEGEQFEEMWTAKLPDDDELDDKLISYEEYETDI